MRYDCSFFLCRMNRTVPSLCRVCPHPIVYCNDHSIIVLLITINVLTTITRSVKSVIRLGAMI